MNDICHCERAEVGRGTSENPLSLRARAAPRAWQSRPPGAGATDTALVG